MLASKLRCHATFKYSNYSVPETNNPPERDILTWKYYRGQDNSEKHMGLPVHFLASVILKVFKIYGASSETVGQGTDFRADSSGIGGRVQSDHG